MVKKTTQFGKLLVIFFIFIQCINFPLIARAENVYVEYHGYVSLDDFNCKNTRSSFLWRICYNKDEKYVITRLHDTYYHYCRVSENIVEEWKDSSSVGKFYNTNIKGNYDCRLGGIPKTKKSDSSIISKIFGNSGKLLETCADTLTINELERIDSELKLYGFDAMNDVEIWNIKNAWNMNKKKKKAGVVWQRYYKKCQNDQDYNPTSFEKVWE